MKQLRIDSVGGASGDMLLGALIDLGVDVDALTGPLNTLPVEPFSIVTESVDEHGLHGTRVHVECDEGKVHRHLSDITAMLKASRIPAPAVAMATRVFGRLADAEATVHNTTPEQIHFHEVGALDSIIDIAGACLGLHLLDITSVDVAPLPVGQGSTTCAHGVLPLPVPATLELLKTHEMVRTDEPFELVTPTGAALLTTWKAEAPPRQALTPLRIGHGFGHRALKGRVNVIRATLLEAGAVDPHEDTCLVLETNLDDMSPELTGALCSRLLEAGALDVFTTAVQMKKQRPGVLLTVLAQPQDRERLIDLIFRESTTFGVRERVERRTVLARRLEPVETPYGTVRMKIGTWQGEDITASPEFEDCRACADAHGVPLRDVIRAASVAWPL